MNMSSSPTTELLSQRLEQAEATVRRLAWTAGCLGLAAVALVLGLLQLRNPARELSAESLVLRDAYGAVRARLELDESGGSELRFLDPNGRTQLLLSAGPQGESSLMMYSRTSMGAALSTGPDGSASLLLTDGDRAQTRLFIDPENAARLVMTQNFQGFDLSVHPDGTSTVQRLEHARDGMPSQITARHEQNAEGPDGTDTARGAPAATDEQPRPEPPPPLNLGWIGAATVLAR